MTFDGLIPLEIISSNWVKEERGVIWLAKKLTQYTYLPDKVKEFTFSEQNIIKFGFCANENLMKSVKLKINDIDIKVNDNGMYEIEAEDSFLDINSVAVLRTTSNEGTLVEGDNFTIDIIEEV